jgi:3-dehydroquinate synthase
MQQLSVSLGSRTYPIMIGTGASSDMSSLAAAIGGPKCVVVTNETVGPLYLPGLRDTLTKVGADSTAVVLPDGEQFKNAGSLNAIHTAMLEARCDRTTTVIALGGGVVGDLAGFAAATYQRGVPFIQIPTTLLSQVDSSVGGKTGINHPLGKNMIGAFWQPKLVLADTEVLATLPARELSAGLAEVIKYGLIRDLPFLQWLESNMSRLMARDQNALAFAIERSCANKAEVVADDEFETAKDGGRALLNLGHTFGHAIETGMGYGAWLHGEAVAAGTMIAATLSQQLGWLSLADLARVESLFVAAGLPTVSPLLGGNRYLELMSHDKKVIAGKLRLVLLRQLGQAETVTGVSTDEIRQAIHNCCVH